MRIKSRREAGDELRKRAERIQELERRNADLVAALNIIASGFKGDKVLAEWEMSNIAAAAVAK